MKPTLRSCFGLALACGLLPAGSQINTGSDGHDGAFNPTVSTNIDMADHPDGIYHYTSVNIPAGVTVTFTPNANNTPVVWLVQGDVIIKGTVDVSGMEPAGSAGGRGGPGGYRGGTGGAVPTAGQGPGGGLPGTPEGNMAFGGNASFAKMASQFSRQEGGREIVYQPPAAPTYGNEFLIPLLGGSGGGGSFNATVGVAAAELSSSQPRV